jgi:putative acyl-CoA dehydrogenase
MRIGARAGAEGPVVLFPARVLPDGARNAVRLQRLKDKLGNRSNASCEVEFGGAAGWLLGDEGRGVQVIIEMVQHTRLDCAIGSAGIVKSAAAQALHHAQHRRAFGRPLAEQPLMQMLADLAIEAEAAVVSALWLASTFEANAGEAEAALSRLATPALKYWLCKRAPMVVAEAIEVLGGNAYVEESALPHLYREVPLNSIWEGSGNIMCPRCPARRTAQASCGGGAAGRARTRERRRCASRPGTSRGWRRDVPRQRARRGRERAARLRCCAGAGRGLLAGEERRSSRSPMRSAHRAWADYAGALGTLPSGIDCAGVLTLAGG